MTAELQNLSKFKSKLLQFKRVQGSIKKGVSYKEPSSEEMMLTKRKSIIKEYSKAKGIKKKHQKDLSGDGEDNENEHILFFDIKTDKNSS